MQFSSVTNVTYPEVYARFLDAVNFINFDVGWMFSTGCLWPDFGFHHLLLVSTLGPLGILAFFGVTYFFTIRKMTGTTGAAGGDGAARKICDAHMSAVLLLTFLVYSSVSSTVFRTFACDDLDDGNRYLRADYRIICTDGKHRAFQAYAGMMILTFPVGIPLLYSVLLYRLRYVLSAAGPFRLENSSARATADLWTPYRPECFYYEVRHSILYSPLDQLYDRVHIIMLLIH